MGQVLEGLATPTQLAKSWIASYGGNLVGSLFIVWLLGQTGLTIQHEAAKAVAIQKTTLTFVEVRVMPKCASLQPRLVWGVRHQKLYIGNSDEVQGLGCDCGEDSALAAAWSETITGWLLFGSGCDLFRRPACVQVPMLQLQLAMLPTLHAHCSATCCWHATSNCARGVSCEHTGPLKSLSHNHAMLSCPAWEQAQRAPAHLHSGPT